MVTWIHMLNEFTERMTSSTEFYPEIPLCLFCTCFVVLFLKDGKHNSLSLPILDPTIEITSFVKSSLTKSLFRMWSTVSIMFFRASFNWRALYLNSDSLFAFSILSCNDLVAGDRNLYESFNRLISWKLRSGVLYWEDSFCFFGVWKWYHCLKSCHILNHSNHSFYHVSPSCHVLSVLPKEQELIPEYWVNIFRACAHASVRPCVRPSVRPCVRPSVRPSAPLHISVGCVYFV